MRKVAVLGYGTVGSGVVAVLEQSEDQIKRKLGEEVQVVKVLDIRDFPGDPIQERIVHDFEEILKDPEIEVVVEVMGGLHPAYEYVSQSLCAGKHVATSNKALVEAYGAELGVLAREHGVSFQFEASVAGGIPILRTLNTAMIQEEIYQVTGILNGTTNYILALMEDTGATFQEALADAQARGYAERDPEADIEGYDAARKIAILASMICGKHIRYQDVPTQGISGITKADIEGAAALGGRLKLLGSCSQENGRFYVSVEPTFVPMDHLLAAVNSVFNAVMLKSSMLGDTMFYGKGAGKLATASAVVADVLAALDGNGVYEMNTWGSEIEEPAHPADRPCRYMVRAEGAQTEHPLFASLVPSEGGFSALTHQCSRKELTALLEQIERQAKVCSVFRKMEE